MQETVNQTNYKPKQGRKVKGESLTQLAEYQPLQKMLANLTIAGLNASAKQALEYYDSYRQEGDIDIPLLPRHIDPDITSVYEVAKHFEERKQEIERKVRENREKMVQEQIKQHEEMLEKAKAFDKSNPGGKPG